MKRDIEVVIKMSGLHFWNGAAEFEQVEYLQHPHRHVFHFELAWDVSHANRDLEFIIQQTKVSAFLIDQYWSEKYQLLDFGGLSCEMIAETLHNEFHCSKVRVSEDGEFYGGVK